MKALVIIPTTTRPVVITSLRERRALPASLVVAEGDFRALPISTDYDKLIGAAGPLGHLTGQPGLPSHELRLSQAFETGRSWEVPVCLAHYIAGRGATLVNSPQEADLIVWATGAVDIDLGIVQDRYFLGQKLQASLQLLSGLRPDARIELFLPKGTLDGMGDPELHKRLADAGVSIVEVRTVREAVDWVEPILAERIGGAAVAQTRAAPPPVPPAADTPGRGDAYARAAGDDRRGRSGLVAVGGLLVLAALAAGGWLWASGRLAGQRAGGAGTQVAAEQKPPPAKETTRPGDKGPSAGQKEGAKQPPAQPKDSGGSGAVAPNPGGQATAGASQGSGSTAAQPKVLNPTVNDPPGDAKPGEAQAAPSNKEQTAAADHNADLLIIEEQRAPPGLTCRQLHFSGQLPEITLLRAKDGRFPASDANGLCALVYRRGAGGAAFGIELDEPFLRVTMDKGVFGRGSTLKAGDVGRVLRDDFRRPLSYSVVLRPTGAAASGPVRFVHELRR